MVYINPDAVHPDFERAMRLRDVIPGARFVTVDRTSGSLVTTTLQKRYQIEESTSRRALVAFTDKGAKVDLVEKAVHPDLTSGKWSSRYLSVVVEKENLVALHAWLFANARSNVAEKLQKEFWEYFLEDADWKDLLRRTRPRR